MAPKIEPLIVKMEQSRSKLNDALDKITPQAEIYPLWEVKQVMDHIAGWDELVIATLGTYLNGETPARGVNSIDQFNAGSVSARKKLTLAQSRQAYDENRQEVIRMLRGLPAVMLSQKLKAPWGGLCTISSIVRIFVSHEQEHAKQIEELLMQSTNSR